MKLVCPPFKGENKGHYSAGVISKGMLYVSGAFNRSRYTSGVSGRHQGTYPFSSRQR